MRRVCRLLEERPGIRLEELSAAAGVSPHHLQKTFKRLMGVTPRQYADARRLGSLKAHLKGGFSVTEATYEAGYGSSSRLYERAASQLGMTPALYRRGGPGLQLRYATFDSPLGRLLVAATERGVCALYLGDSDGPLESALREEYKAAEIRRDEAGLRRLVEPVLSQLEGRAPLADFPLDVRATAFQRRVWEELRRIPLGETRTYGEMARAIGKPRAVRAVARACAQNRVSVVIPCHRVVAADGSLTGYRWGLERKAKLLAQEREVAARSRRGVSR